MLRILHSSDWHLGQKLFGWERYEEQVYMLDQISAVIRREAIDVLLVSGDVFDTVNPSADTDTLYYRFLAELHRDNPQLQVIIAAGNHDSPARLKAPAPLLKAMNITVVSTVEKMAGIPSYSHLIVPLGERDNPSAICLVLPFLRYHDFPTGSREDDNPLATFVKEAFALAASQGLPVVIMAHLYVTGATSASSEQGHAPAVMGHSEQVSADIFPKEASYVALGHIHRAQQIGKEGRIRYAGSPLPMSFSEKSYSHGVVRVDLYPDGHADTRVVPILPPAPLCLLKGEEEELLLALEALETKENDFRTPYLSIVLRSAQPRPDLLAVFRDKCKGKYVRLTNVRRERLTPETVAEKILPSSLDLSELSPLEVARLVYAEDNGGDAMPDDLAKLFLEVANEVQP